MTPQYGVGGYRIDFAAAHPDKPGRMVLAIELDGDTYHRSATARDRDRLRQEHLERLGWRFHRIWSSAWVRDPDTELTKAYSAWRAAVVESDVGLAAPRPTAEPPSPLHPSDEVASSTETRRGTPPLIVTRARLGDRRASINAYSDTELDALLRWVRGDGLLRDRDQLVDAAREELGFRRRGSEIQRRLGEAVDRTAGESWKS